VSPFAALGIDVGSSTAKIVAIDATGLPMWHHLEATEPGAEDQVARLIDRARQAGGGIEGVPLVATGYGRKLVRLATQRVTEITCHARGIACELGRGGLLIDIGGQDSKVIRTSPRGDVLDFTMNDKCAAGTGRFLENVAARLGLTLEQMGGMAASASDEVAITSTCTVFTETEVVSLLAQGTPLEPLVRGVHRALVRRIVGMARSVGWDSPILLSGGVALNPAIRLLVQAETGLEVVVSSRPQLVGAHGAALIALEG
jgi:predicted CoA-substrate-specific enzyme activase